MVKRYSTLLVAIFALGLDIDQVKRGLKRVEKYRKSADKRDGQ